MYGYFNILNISYSDNMDKYIYLKSDDSNIFLKYIDNGKIKKYYKYNYNCFFMCVIRKLRLDGKLVWGDWYKTIDKFDLVILGENYYSFNISRYIKKKMEQMNLNWDAIIETSTKNVVKTFNELSIFVMPSRYEGYANVLVEAMACGMPCVSYNWLMGVDEIIKDNKNGFIVKLKDREKYFNGEVYDEDVENLANRINYMIENEDVCKKMGEEAKKIIETRKADMIIDKWIKLIQKGGIIRW